MSYRLIALDLDGTLVGRDLVISPRVKAAVAAARKRGVHGCIVTGRMFQAALPFARALDLDAPIVCYQGAAIVDPHSDEVLRHTPVPPDLVAEIVSMAKSDGKHLQLYANDQYYVEEENEFSGLYAELSQVRPVRIDSFEREFALRESTKAVIVDRAAHVDEYLPRVHAALGARAYVTRSYPQFIEILNPQVHKGEALAVVAQRLQIPMEEVLAVGDAWNDAPLLEAAGFGVAMGSAPPELLAVADAVVGDVRADGVAEAIERYVLA